MGFVRVNGVLVNSKGLPITSSTATAVDNPGPTIPYQVTIAQRDPPKHAVVATLHDKPPTPSEGGGGWEEVSLPRRPAVLIWKGRGLMKMTFSLVLDSYVANVSVFDDSYRTLCHFWRPEGSKNSDTVEPSVLTLAAAGDVIPFKNLKWVIEDLEWGDAQGNSEAQRTQQILVVTLKEFRADVRLKPGGSKKPPPRTQPYKVKKGDTLAKIAEAHGISAKALGELQKPPIRDSRHLKVGSTIVVPVGKHSAPEHRTLAQKYGHI